MKRPLAKNPAMVARKIARPEERPLATNFIRAWRKHRRLTLEGLAHKAGLAVSTIAEIERGDHDFTGRSLRQIADALEVSPAVLLGTDPSHDNAEIWEIWDNLSQRGRADQARAILRALRDTPPK